MSNPTLGISREVRSNTIAHLLQAAAEIAADVAGGLAEAAQAAAKEEINQAIGTALPAQDQIAVLHSLCQAAFALNRVRAL